MFHSSSCEIYLLLNTKNPMLLKFVDMLDIDKYRLRLVYNVMSASICGVKFLKR